jgi:hypothetical protein
VTPPAAPDPLSVARGLERSADWLADTASRLLPLLSSALQLCARRALDGAAEAVQLAALQLARTVLSQATLLRDAHVPALTACASILAAATSVVVRSAASHAIADASAARGPAAAALLMEQAMRAAARRARSALRGGAEAEQLAALRSLQGLASASAAAALPAVSAAAADLLLAAILPACELAAVSGGRRHYAYHVSPGVTAAAVDCVRALASAGLAGGLADAAMRTLADCPPPHPDASAALCVLAALCGAPVPEPLLAGAVACACDVLRAHSALHIAARQARDINAHGGAAAAAVDCIAAAAATAPQLVRRTMHATVWPLVQALGCAGCLAEQRSATAFATERVAASLGFANFGTRRLGVQMFH